ncbi:MAG: hypothetical protein ACI9WU_000668 [Myxococcota bacterium]|jgi:hypothetical protein
MSYGWYTWLLLFRPARVQANLDVVRDAGLVKVTPNLWQICLGVLRMWHRILFRSETIGLCGEQPRRKGWRARLFEPRLLRGPFVLMAGSVAPWDLSGLLSSPDRLIRHLVGTHHEQLQFVYDLQILRAHPGRMEQLHRETLAVIERDDRRSRWLRDLCVYEGYHEQLLEVVQANLAGDFGAETPFADNADVSFVGYLDWCAAQPDNPRDAWRAWRAGTLRFASKAPAEVA